MKKSDAGLWRGTLCLDAAWGTPGQVSVECRPRLEQNVVTPWGVFGTICFVIAFHNPSNGK